MHCSRRQRKGKVQNISLLQIITFSVSRTANLPIVEHVVCHNVAVSAAAAHHNECAEKYDCIGTPSTGTAIREPHHRSATEPTISRERTNTHTYTSINTHLYIFHVVWQMRRKLTSKEACVRLCVCASRGSCVIYR